MEIMACSMAVQNIDTVVTKCSIIRGNTYWYLVL